MSAASVDLVRELYGAFARWEAAVALARLRPDVESRRTALVDGPITRPEICIDTPAMRTGRESRWADRPTASALR